MPIMADAHAMQRETGISLFRIIAILKTDRDDTGRVYFQIEYRNKLASKLEEAVARPSWKEDLLTIYEQIMTQKELMPETYDEEPERMVIRAFALHFPKNEVATSE